MRTKISILAVILLILSVNVVTAQLYEIPLDQRIQQSSTIVEGKVIESKTYRGSDGNIYTANEVQVFSALKGNLSKSKITIITFGGILNDKRETWTHLLNLAKDEIGLFFLTPTNRPLSGEIEGLDNVYEVYSSSQGFLKYSENQNKTMVATAPFNYHLRNNILQTIRQSTGQFIPIFEENDGNPEDRTGVEYSIQNLSLSGNTLDFDVYVEGLWGSYDLTKSELIIEYDPTVLGSNISSNGIITVTKGTVSNSPNYNLAVGDVNPDELSIKVEALNTGFGLYTITNLQEQLIHIQITSPNAGNPDIEFDEANMQQLSEFLDQNNLPEVFQQVFAVGSVNDIGGGSSVAPNIQSFFPTTVAGGVRDTLTIVGSDFGNSPDGIRPPNDKRLLFTPAPETFPPNYFWSTPINSPTQYISWSDDTIRVIVPSIARDVNNPAYAGGVVTDAACSELIGILDLSTPQPTIAQNNSSLYVKYSAVNQGFVNQGNEHIARAKLGNENGAGGYDLYYSPSFDTLKGGQAKEAFERALVTWRCNTLVNFRIQDFNGVPPANACLIDFGALPAGVSQALRATTEYAPFNFCGGVIADNLMFENLTNFTMTFSNNVNWHCDVTQPALNFNTDIDLETAALHEIGHAHLLWHTNNPANVMYFCSDRLQESFNQ